MKWNVPWYSSPETESYRSFSYLSHASGHLKSLSKPGLTWRALAPHFLRSALLLTSPEKNAHIHCTAATAAAKSLQSCPTLCDPLDGSHQAPHPWDSPGKNSGVGCHFLLQCMKVKSLSRVQLLATPWTAAYQTPPYMGFSRQEYWSGFLGLPSIPRTCPVFWVRTPHPAADHSPLCWLQIHSLFRGPLYGDLTCNLHKLQGNRRELWRHFCPYRWCPRSALSHTPRWAGRPKGQV